MPRKCSVCSHKDRDSIDVAIADQKVSYRHLASKYGVSLSSMYRHGRNHVPEMLAKAHEIKEVAHADNLLERIESLITQSEQLLTHGQTKKQGRDWAAGLRELRKSYELLARVSGELDERPQINLIATEQWINLRTVILHALIPYPDAKQAIVEALNADSNDSD